jgi:hypothetical protein
MPPISFAVTGLPRQSLDHSVALLDSMRASSMAAFWNLQVILLPGA